MSKFVQSLFLVFSSEMVNTSENDNELVPKRILDADGLKYQCPYEDCKKSSVKKFRIMHHMRVAHQNIDELGRRKNEACTLCGKWILICNVHRHRTRRCPLRSLNKLKSQGTKSRNEAGSSDLNS